MSTPAPLPPARPAVRRGPSRVKLFFWLVVLPVLLAVGYFWAVLKWSYSSGERAGWVQQFSKRGWLCKTWEGEMAMVTMPGGSPEKFYFTVWDDAVAEQINRVMGKRVTLHYEQKVGLPTSCFGETRYIVTAVKAVEEIPLAPGIVVPVPQPGPPSDTAKAAPVPPAPPPTTPAPPNTAPAPALPDAVTPTVPPSSASPAEAQPASPSTVPPAPVSPPVPPPPAK